MSFVTTTPPPAPADEPEIASGAFWPPVKPADVRVAQRIDGDITAPRLKGALVEAIADVNSQLATWRLARQAEGIATLAEVPADEVAGVSILVQRYHRAVGSLAKALLMERYRDVDTTARGDRKADAMENPIDDLRRDARWAVSDITGARRTTVELI